MSVPDDFQARLDGLVRRARTGSPGEREDALGELARLREEAQSRGDAAALGAIAGAYAALAGLGASEETATLVPVAAAKPAEVRTGPPAPAEAPADAEAAPAAAPRGWLGDARHAAWLAIGALAVAVAAFAIALGLWLHTRSEVLDLRHQVDALQSQTGGGGSGIEQRLHELCQRLGLSC